MDFATWQQGQDVRERIAGAPIGVLVAAWVHDHRHGWIVASGRMITKRLFDDDGEYGEIEIVTIKNFFYRVPFSRVIWVKTGNFWPSFVMDHFRKVKASLEEKRWKRGGENANLHSCRKLC